MKKYITIKKTAEVMGVSVPTVYRYVRKGILEIYSDKDFPGTYIDYYSIPTFLREKEEKNI